MDVIAQKELETRTDSLEKKIIDAASAEKLFVFLKATDRLTGEIHLNNAIYLGLLGKIGVTLGREKLTELICPNEPMAEAYADILSAFDKPQLDDWLSILDESHQSMMMEKIHESIAQGYKPTLIERLKTVLRNSDDPGVIGLLTAVSKLDREAGAEKIEPVLNEWLMNKATSNIAKDIRHKAIDLGLLVTDTNAEGAALAVRSSNEARHPQEDFLPVAYEELPDDPTEQMLAELEARFNASPQGFAQDSLNRLFAHRRQEPGDAAAPSSGPVGP